MSESDTSDTVLALRAVIDGIVLVNEKPLTETVNGFQLTATLSHGTETVNETRGHCGY